MKTLLVIVVLLAIVFLSGCSHYVAPGAGLAPASLAGPGGSVVQASPTARFPARVAVVRVQAPNYRNHNTDGYGSGAFSVVTTREIESDDDFARLSKLPQLAGIAMLNRLVLPPHFTGDRELRQAAAKLQADVLL
ncbi:MAG: hypothetical protein H7Z14_14245, partial [Anaerolineae bacterium]|nr:hypothetical protein [Phycisphaerae bacterium]